MIYRWPVGSTISIVIVHYDDILELPNQGIIASMLADWLQQTYMTVF